MAIERTSFGSITINGKTGSVSLRDMQVVLFVGKAPDNRDTPGIGQRARFFLSQRYRRPK